MKINLHVNKISFLFEKMGTKTLALRKRFNWKRWNSERSGESLCPFSAFVYLYWFIVFINFFFQSMMLSYVYFDRIPWAGSKSSGDLLAINLKATITE